MQKPLLIFFPLMDPVLLDLKPEDFAGHHILLLNRIPVDMQGFTTEKPSIVEDMNGNIRPVNMPIKMLTKISKHRVMSWGRGFVGRLNLIFRTWVKLNPVVSLNDIG